MITKTQIRIMKIFVSRITDKFSIKQVSEIMKKPYALVHRSIIPLIKEGLITKDEKELLFLNYRENLAELAYIESIRKNEFLMHDKTISLFAKDVLNKINLDFFVFLLFGSSVDSKNTRDADVLFIVENEDDVKNTEKIISNIASNFSKEFDVNVISKESVYEMLTKREQKNAMNETLNKHVLLFGAESYYRMLKNAR